MTPFNGWPPTIRIRSKKDPVVKKTPTTLVLCRLRFQRLHLEPFYFRPRFSSDSSGRSLASCGAQGSPARLGRGAAAWRLRATQPRRLCATQPRRTKPDFRHPAQAGHWSWTNSCLFRQSFATPAPPPPEIWYPNQRDRALQKSCRGPWRPRQGSPGFRMGENRPGGLPAMLEGATQRQRNDAECSQGRAQGSCSRRDPSP